MWFGMGRLPYATGRKGTLGPRGSAFLGAMGRGAGQMAQSSVAPTGEVTRSINGRAPSIISRVLMR